MVVRMLCSCVSTLCMCMRDACVCVCVVGVLVKRVDAWCCQGAERASVVCSVRGLYFCTGGSSVGERFCAFVRVCGAYARVRACGDRDPLVQKRRRRHICATCSVPQQRLAPHVCSLCADHAFTNTHEHNATLKHICTFPLRTLPQQSSFSLFSIPWLEQFVLVPAFRSNKGKPERDPVFLEKVIARVTHTLTHEYVATVYLSNKGCTWILCNLKTEHFT